MCKHKLLLSQANFATKASAAALAGFAIGSRRWRPRACRLRSVPALPARNPTDELLVIILRNITKRS